MPVRIRSSDFGIIYAASVANSGRTYVDRKSVTQSFIELTSSYTEMVTIETGDVDTSKPFADATIGMTLAVSMTFNNTTEVRLKLQFRRWDEVTDPNAWADLQLVSQTSGTIAAEQAITGAAQTVRVGLQTASEFTAGQVRVVAKYVGAGPDEDDALVVRGEAL